MAESSWPSPSNGRVVDDVQFEKMGLGLGPTAGVLGDFTSPQLVYGDSSGMQIKVAADRYALVSGHVWWSGSSIFTKSIGANASGSTRTDLVVARLSRTTWDVTIVVVAGTPGAGAPAPTQNTGTTGSYDLPLATVTVASGAGTVSAGNVTYLATHLVPNGGYVVPSIAALTYVPAKVTGMLVYVSDVKLYKTYDGAAWGTQGLNLTPYTGQAQDSTTVAVSSTTYAAGSPVVGFAFTAPPSGQIELTVGGYIVTNNNTVEIRLSFEVRAGATVGSGTVVWAASHLRGIVAGTAVNAGATARAAGTWTAVIGALTPLSSYNVRTMHALDSAGSGGVNYRTLLVKPYIT